MKELGQSQYKIILPLLKEIDFETAFSYSIVENRQKGRIFVDTVINPGVALFWHYCGFAYLAGDPDKSDFDFFFCFFAGKFEYGQRRFILHISQKKME